MSFKSVFVIVEMQRRLNPSSPNSDQHQISPHRINVNITHTDHENLANDHQA